MDTTFAIDFFSEEWIRNATITTFLILLYFFSLSKVKNENLELFLKVSKIFKLNFTGIDYITNNLSIPYYFSDGNILEVNTKPGFVGILENNPSTFFNTLFNK